MERTNAGRPKRSTFDQRVAWLLQNKEAMQVLKHADVIRAMKKDGLIAPTTYIHDCRFFREFSAAGYPDHFQRLGHR